jgi:major vault protein
MAAIERDQKDLVLGPGSHAFVLDKSKGQISVWTGPVRVSLSNTDDTVVWNTRDRRFSPIPVVENAIQPNVVAREGEYIILENPTMSGEEHPPAGSNASAATLAMGKTMVSHGPASFALWPMQSASVVPGHILRSDQYLIVKVVDEAAARQHFDKAVIKGSGGAKDVIKLDELSTGRLFIIPGTEVNFYMPCSGIEVLKIDGAFVQDAVTVEAMEYAYLRDQSGKKRYAYGPDVVFPKPTETFVTRHLDDGSMTKTFRVIELTETSGLYIKVIEDYRDGEVDRKAGDELFITYKSWHTRSDT